MTWLAFSLVLGLIVGVLLGHRVPSIWRRWREKRRLKNFKLKLLQPSQPKWETPVPLVDNVPAVEEVIHQLQPSAPTPKKVHFPLTLELEALPTPTPKAKVENELVLDEDDSHTLTLVDYESVSTKHHFQIKKQGDSF
jgi:hypothetical protein